MYLIAMLVLLVCQFVPLSVERSWIRPDRWASDHSSKPLWVDRIIVTLGDFPLLL